MVSRCCWPLLTTHYHIRLRSKLICYHLRGWRAKESPYPVVTGDEEVISALRVVPKRVPLSHGVDIVFDESGEREHGARVRNVEMGHHLLDAVGEEEHVCLLWIVYEVLACVLHARYELPLGGVDSRQRPRVDERLATVSRMASKLGSAESSVASLIACLQACSSSKRGPAFENLCAYNHSHA